MNTKWVRIVGSVLSLLFVVLVVYFFAKDIRVAEALITKAGFAGPIITVIIYGIFSLTPVTTEPLTVISGILFGPVLGVIVSWVGNTLAAFTEYYLGKRLSKAANFEKLKKRLPFGLGKLPVSSPYFLVFGRFIPGFGSKVVGLMGGMYNVPLKIYFWTALLTNFLGSVLLSYGGYNLIHYVKRLNFY